MKIGDKYFLNLQETVAWLLANNALPFQCNVNYVANTEIAKSAIINPAPNEIRVGALVLFADSKIGTISGLTSNGFMVGSEYTDLHTALNYITNVSQDASGYLYVTLSDGSTINAGQIKQVTNFNINGSQHLIVNYNDGTNTDLGAIFSGNVNISGNLTADSIIENMPAGYGYDIGTINSAITKELVYAGAVKNGNKLSFVLAMNITRTDSVVSELSLGSFSIPADVSPKLFPTNIGGLDVLTTGNANAKDYVYSIGVELPYYFAKGVNLLYGAMANTSQLNNLTLNTKYYIRIEMTFLLSDNLGA